MLLKNYTSKLPSNPPFDFLRHLFYLIVVIYINLFNYFYEKICPTFIPNCNNVRSV